VTGAAPCFNRLLLPSQARIEREPGTRTPRALLQRHARVMSEPERCAASITIHAAAASPEIRRLRRGKSRRRGSLVERHFREHDAVSRAMHPQVGGVLGRVDAVDGRRRWPPPCRL